MQHDRIVPASEYDELIKAKELIGYDDFIQNKLNEEKADKMAEKLRKLGGRG